MTDNNIDNFNDVAAEIFSRLYSSFPHPTTLNMNDIAQSALDNSEKRTVLFATNTAKWLEKSGFFTAKMWYLRGGEVGYSILTIKGLDVLRQVPDVVSGQKRLGEQVVDATKSGGKGVARKIVDVIIQKGTEIGLAAVGIL